MVAVDAIDVAAEGPQLQSLMTSEVVLAEVGTKALCGVAGPSIAVEAKFAYRFAEHCAAPRIAKLPELDLGERHDVGQGHVRVAGHQRVIVSHGSERIIQCRVLTLYGILMQTARVAIQGAIQKWLPRRSDGCPDFFDWRHHGAVKRTPRSQ